MELHEAYQILRQEPPSLITRLWQSTVRSPGSENLKAAMALIAASPPETVLADLAEILWNAGKTRTKLLAPLFINLAFALPTWLWPRIDEKIRTGLKYSRKPDSDWRGECGALVIIGMSHPSGYVREASILRSGQLDPVVSVPLLFLRINDWVAPVRNAVAPILTTTLKKLRPKERMMLAPLVARLGQCARRDTHDLVDKWLPPLANPFDPEAWTEVWQADKGSRRRTYLEILKRSGHIPDAALRKLLFASNDRHAMLWIIRSILPFLEGLEREEAVSRIRHSRTIAVRREWLSMVLETRPREEVVGELRNALLAANGSLRQFASFHLSRIESMDFVEYYLDALTRPETEGFALRGLADIEPALAHCEAVARLDSQRPVVLKAAVEALSQNSLEEFFHRLIDLAGSRMPGIPKVARKRLLEIRRFVGADLIANPENFDSYPESVQIHLTRMAPFFQVWDGLEFILNRLSERSCHEEALKSYRKWRWREKDGTASRPLERNRQEKLLKLIENSGLESNQLETLIFLLKHSV